MKEIINTFEQFCKKRNKNVTIEEKFEKDGTRILKCYCCDDSEGDCKCIERLNYNKFSKNQQK